jgi:hypothetical protein
MRQAAKRRLRSIRQALLPLLGFTGWHEDINLAGRPVWRRYIARTDSWEFRPMTPEEEAKAINWYYPPYMM